MEGRSFTEMRSAYHLSSHRSQTRIGFWTREYISQYVVDRLNYILPHSIPNQKAVSIFSDVRLNKDYPSKVIQAISLSDDACPLILKYVRTAKPQLTKPTDIDIYLGALVESSLLEAWQFQRTFPEASEIRQRLLHKIFEWCLAREFSNLQGLSLMWSDIFKAHPRPGHLAQLLSFPFSDYEHNLIYRYALHPPSTLSKSSIPIVQELICVRQIQSGQYSSAIKLDRRFAATVIPGATPKMRKMVQERRKMMDELLATLPAVERQLVEAELEAEESGSGKIGEPTPFFGKGQGRAEGLAMSWEKLRHPNANANANGSARTVPQPGMSSTSSRNDTPHLVSRPPTSTLVNGSALLTSSTSNPITSRVQSSPFTSRTNYVFPLSSSQSSRMPAPLLNSSGIKYPTTLFNQPSPAARVAPTPASKPTTSLFSMTGSANQTRNAFYNPPVTNGVKRSLGEDEARSVADAPSNPVDEHSAPVVDKNDVNMKSDDDDDDARGDATSEMNGNDVTTPAEFSYSVFGNKSAAKQPPLTSRRFAKASSTEMKMPPGAYMHDDDEIAAATTSQVQNQRHASVSPPPQPTRQTRKLITRTQKLVKESDLKRSLPGSFMAEDHGDEEEEDQVAPLPAPPKNKRPPRKTRSSQSVEPEDAPARPTRRSTRISTASSITSGSPEPPSPQRKSTRKSTKTSTSSKTKSRKK